MIKDLVVSLGVAGKGDCAGDFAISVAATLAAHLTGIAYVYDPGVPGIATGYLPADVIEARQRDSEDAANSALERFKQAAARAGIDADAASLPANYADAGEQFGRIARRFDLAIVAQAEPGTAAVEEQIAESALFDSGRPVIMVPYIQSAPFKLDRVMVCWDGSRAATRAIGDAMPLLARAGRIEVVSVADDPGKRHEIPGADMGRHLARHGLQLEVTRLSGTDIDVADALLSRAADTGADFIVLGGFGHSRLREFLLGGVTRGILRSMTVPVLMSH